MARRLSLPKVFSFEWDGGNLEHIKKHNVESEECEELFYNDALISEDIQHSVGEERAQVLGQTYKERLLFLVFTVRNNKIRVISARDQNKKERKQYAFYKEVKI